ncbi:MAG TPA: hypothetical protein PKY82_02385 [Pyrinomonadaceae bacterium]|nr:hypothetical protein [Pyrinomonadaceae bacterium]
MGRKKLTERRVSDIPHRVKLYETTQSYVAQQQKLTGKKQVDIIRELCEIAHQEELTKGQFSSGTTKIFRSTQGKVLKHNVAEPLENLTKEIQNLRREIQDVDIHTRFGTDEIFRVLKAFYIENSILVELVHKLEKDPNRKINVADSRKKLQEKYESGFETRRDLFYEKYHRTIMELNENDSLIDNLKLENFLDDDEDN